MWFKFLPKYNVLKVQLLCSALILSLSGCTSLTVMDYLFPQPVAPEKYPPIPPRGDCIVKVSFLDLTSRPNTEIAVDKTFVAYSSWSEGASPQAKYQINLQAEFQNPDIPKREYIRLSLPSFAKGVYAETKDSSPDNARFSYVNNLDSDHRVNQQLTSAKSGETQIEVVVSLGNQLWGNIQAVIGTENNSQRYLVNGLFNCNTKHVFAKETQK